MQKGRFERLALLGSGTVTVTEKAKVTTGTSVGRIVTLVRLLPHAEADAAAHEKIEQIVARAVSLRSDLRRLEKYVDVPE